MPPQPSKLKPKKYLVTVPAEHSETLETLSYRVGKRSVPALIGDLAIIAAESSAETFPDAVFAFRKAARGELDFSARDARNQF